MNETEKLIQEFEELIKRCESTAHECYELALQLLATNRPDNIPRAKTMLKRSVELYDFGDNRKLLDGLGGSSAS